MCTLDIAPDKAFFPSKKQWYFSYFSMKAYVVGTHMKHLMSTHNFWQYTLLWRNKKNTYPLLSGAMLEI